MIRYGCRYFKSGDFVSHTIKHFFDFYYFLYALNLVSTIAYVCLVFVLNTKIWKSYTVIYHFIGAWTCNLVGQSRTLHAKYVFICCSHNSNDQKKLISLQIETEWFLNLESFFTYEKDGENILILFIILTFIYYSINKDIKWLFKFRPKYTKCASNFADNFIFSSNFGFNIFNHHF